MSEAQQKPVEDPLQRAVLPAIETQPPSWRPAYEGRERRSSPKVTSTIPTASPKEAQKAPKQRVPATAVHLLSAESFPQDPGEESSNTKSSRAARGTPFTFDRIAVTYTSETQSYAAKPAKCHDLGVAELLPVSNQ